jgi:uncharacterized membrane protein YfcA
MIKFISGFMAGGFIGYLLGQVIPFEYFLIVSVLLLFISFVLFTLFHLGLRDFQEY